MCDLWKKALAQTPEEILDDVLSGEGRAGFTAIALALYATPTSIEIINANAIYNKHLSGDDAIKQCHKVLIEEHLGGGAIDQGGRQGEIRRRATPKELTEADQVVRDKVQGRARQTVSCGTVRHPKRCAYRAQPAERGSGGDRCCSPRRPTQPPASPRRGP